MLSRYFILLAVIVALVAVLAPPVLTIAIVLSVLAIFFLARNLEFGLILLVFFFPYMGLMVDFGAFQSLRNVPYLKNINAPFMDLLGLMLFVAWGIVVIFKYLKIKKLKELKHCFPFWRSYTLFWLSGLVSLFSVSSYQFGASFKYFARPFTFCYLVFFAPVIHILTRFSTSDAMSSNSQDEAAQKERRFKLFHRVLWVFFATGLVSAINGLLGLFFSNYTEFPRATPFSFFGISPLGYNHNLLAETLIATAPAGLLLMEMKDYSLKAKQWILGSMFFQWVIALLTFARTAWIAITLQAIIYILVFHRKRLRDFLKSVAPIIILLAILSVFLVSTVFTETVRGSTMSRLQMAQIAVFYFERSPLIGIGIGTFVPTLWQTYAFVLNFGEPIDAHGILFKLMLEQGAFGLITFGIFAGAILWTIGKGLRGKTGITEQGKTILLSAFLIAAGSLAYQIFNTTYYSSKLWIPLAIAVVITRIYYENAET